MLGEAAYAPIVVTVVERPGNLIWHVAIFQIEVVVRPICRSPGTRRSLPAHCIGFMNVELSDPFCIRIENNGDSWIAVHAAAIGVHDFPAFQITSAAALGELDEGVDFIIDHSGLQDS